MRDFHYNYILLKYGNNENIFLTNTIDLLSEICTENIVENLKDKESFDISDYSEYSNYVIN